MFSNSWDIVVLDGLLCLLHLPLSAACPLNVTAASLFCTNPVQQKYLVVVDQIIAGNDSGVPDLCRSYTIMLHCLHEVVSDCGRWGRTAYTEASKELQETVGRYCQYYWEEYQMYEDREIIEPFSSSGSPAVQFSWTRIHASSNLTIVSSVLLIFSVISQLILWMF